MSVRCKRGGAQVLFKHKKQQSPLLVLNPLDPAYLEHLSVGSSARLPDMRLTISGRVSNHVALVVTSWKSSLET
jgi:hypothetical protein